MKLWKECAKQFELAGSSIIWKRNARLAGTLASGYMKLTLVLSSGKHVRTSGHALSWMLDRKRDVKRGYDIHHRDHDKLNNHPSNLVSRKHTRHVSEHAAEMYTTHLKSRSSTNPILGVRWAEKQHRWRVRLRVSGVMTHLGYFASMCDGVNAYWDARILEHSEQKRELNKARRTQLVLASAMDASCKYDTQKPSRLNCTTSSKLGLVGVTRVNGHTRKPWNAASNTAAAGGVHWQQSHADPVSAVKAYWGYKLANTVGRELDIKRMCKEQIVIARKLM